MRNDISFGVLDYSSALSSRLIARVSHGKSINGVNKFYLGNSGLPLIYRPSEVDSISDSYQLSGYINKLPAVPMLIGNKACVVKTVITNFRKTISMDDSPLNSELLDIATTIEQAILQNKLDVPRLVTVSHDKYMAPVVTDSRGRKYHSTLDTKVLYCNDLIEAQAVVMSSTLPLCESLLPLAIDHMKIVLPHKEPGNAFIYSGGTFIDVFEET